METIGYFTLHKLKINKKTAYKVLCIVIYLSDYKHSSISSTIIPNSPPEESERNVKFSLIEGEKNTQY